MKRFFLLLALGVSAVLPTAARADNIDVELDKQASKIVQYARDHGYQNVGVLKFRVKKGDRPVSFQAGTMNSNMAIRLENALVMHDTGSKPIGIIHDASSTASARKLPAYTNPKARPRLFQENYPLAWGDQQVKPDGFFTGQVTVSPDMRRTTVLIEAFDRKTPDKVSKVLEFSVKTDRSILADLGQNFVVSSRALRRDGEDIDIAAEDSAANKDKQQPTTPTNPSSPTTPTSPTTPSEDKAVSLEIRFDGQPQAPTADPESPGEMRVPEPREGQKVTFVIRNVSSERIGVVLKVNGKNSLFEEMDEPVRCTKWILDPNDQYEIQGFHIDDKTSIPFKVLTQAESEAVSYTDSLGVIQVFAFRAVPDQNMKISLSRGLTARNSAKVPKARTLAERQSQLASLTKAGSKTTSSKVVKRGVIEKDDPSAGKQDEVKRVEFPPNAQLQSSETVRYYKPKQ